MSLRLGRRFTRSTLGCLAVNIVLAAVVPVFADPTTPHTLEEQNDDGRVFQIDSHVVVTGSLETASGGGKSVSHKLKVDARQRFLERRLSGTGRDAETLRSLRQYQSARATINVAKQVTSARLRNDRRQVVAQGRREGIEFASPSGRMTFGELELLHTPGDVLAILPLLPQGSVAIGDEWDTDSWAIQMLTSTEAVLESELKCKLDSIVNDIAKVTIHGSIKGATDGASTEIKLSGHYLFDLKRDFVTQLELEQKEKRSVGPVTPGIDIVASVRLKRGLSAAVGPLDDATVATIPLEMDESLLMLELRTPWNLRFQHGRGWHVFHQSGQVAVLRLLDKGSLIAQCNISKITDAKPGRHTSEEQFQKDIRSALGEKLKEISQAELLTRDDKEFRYRVTAIGESNGLAMTWLYYLCADQSGHQVAFVFAVETKLLDRLSNRDLGMIQSLQFLDSNVRPASAEP